MWAGRPFFIRIGTSQASDGAGRQQSGQDAGPSRGSRSSTLASSSTASSAAGVGRGAAQQHPDDVRTVRGVAGAGADADRGHGHRGQGLAAGGQRPDQGHPGRGGQFARAVAADPPAAGQFGDRGSGHRQAAVGGPDAARAEGDLARRHRRDAQVVEGRAHPDHVGDRVERTHLVEVHLVGGDAVDGRLGGGQAFEDRLRGRHAWRRAGQRGARMSRHCRCGGLSTSGVTCTFVARNPARRTSSTVTATDPGRTASIAARTASRRAPASSSAPSSMSPAIPAEASIQACRRAARPDRPVIWAARWPAP